MFPPPIKLTAMIWLLCVPLVEKHIQPTKIWHDSETHQDPKACNCGKVFSTSEGLKEHKRAKHEFRYSCTD
jgi:hypothetical protein